MEIRLLSDPEYAQEFDVAVDQIIDRYVAGEFHGPDLDRVRNYFFKSEQRQEKLRFALALKEQKGRRNSSPPKINYRPYLKVAAVIITIVGIGYFAWLPFRTQPDLMAGLTALQAAFPEERPIEGRLSDFKYVPLPNQRGSSSKVDHVQRDTAGTLLLQSVRNNPTASSHHAVAKYYLMLRQFDEANKELTAALALEPQNAKIHSDFGAALLEEGRAQNSSTDNSRQLELYGRSLEHIDKALALDPSLQEALFNRALILQFMSPSEQAKEAWNAYLQKDNTSPWAEEARKNLKLIEQEQHKTSTGQNEDQNLFLAALRNSDDDTAWKVISTNYTSGGNEIANRLLDALLGVEPFGEALDSRATLAALQYVAKLEFERAGDRFTSDVVSNYSRAGPHSISLATARRHMRMAYSSFEKNRFPEAINEYNKAKSIYEQAHDSAGTIFVEYRLAHCYVLLPDTERARTAFSRLLTITETNQYRWLIAQSLYGLANANADSSAYSKALDYSALALTKFQQIGDPSGVVKCLTQLADFNQALNRIPPALGHLSRALSLTNETFSDAKQQRWGVLNQIGFSMTSLQLHAAALFYQKEALHLAKELDTPLKISRSYSYLGSAYAAMQMYPQAVNEAAQAFEVGRSVTGKRGLEVRAHASQQLGDINRAAGRCDQAIEYYDQGLRLYQRLNVDFYSYFAHKGKLHCYIATGNKPAVRREFQQVLGHSELYRSRITDENQRTSFFDAEQGVYDLAIGYAFSVEQDYTKALEYSEKSRARSLLDAVERAARMRTQRKTTEVKSAVVTSPLRVSEIQAKMPDAAQLVQYALLDDKVIVWVITKEQVSYEELPVNARSFNDTINAFLEMVNHPPGDVAFQRDHSTELFNTLIQPIRKYLDESKVLVIIPDKILNYLPFAALTSPVTSTFLIEAYEVTVAPSATIFVNRSAAAERLEKRGLEHLVSVGDPLFDRKAFNSLRQLPTSVAEARNVGQFYQDPQILVREDATETAVRRKIEKADVVHLAMHFVLNEQSEMLSGFPLTPERSDPASNNSDGFLQSFEIAHLNLRRTRLAVLSACQTGIEKQYSGEGAVGAARPFFVAGVPTVVASLWPVDSDASAELMVSFHRHRLKRLSTTQALRLAQSDMIKSTDARRRHPYYWAPFLAIGGIARQ